MPPAGERPCAKHFTFAGRARLCGAPTRCASICLPVGRARGAPCKTAARSANGKAIALPLTTGPWCNRPAFGRRAVVQAARLWETSSGQATGKPMLRTCQVRSSFAVRAPCAHHWKASGPPMARRFAKKRAATGKGNERKARIAEPFTAEGPALGNEREARIAKPFTVEGPALGNERKARIAKPFTAEGLAPPLAAGPCRRRAGHRQKKWSGRRESNPRKKHGKLLFCH